MSEEKKSKSKSGKTRITIRLDPKIIAWFKQQAEENLGSTYQALINDALLKHIENQAYSIEETIRRTIREELAVYKVPAEVKSIPVKPNLPKGSPINDELPDSNPFKGLVGIFHGGPSDTAERAEEILEAEVHPIYGFGGDRE